MTAAQGAVLGVVQGATEFLPISSSAHLVLVPHLLGWENPSVTFGVFLHLGTLVAVLSFFWQELKVLIRAWAKSIIERSFKNDYSKLAWLILIGTIPGALIAYYFKDFLEKLFIKPFSVSWLLLVTGGILWLSEAFSKKNRELNKINLVDALIIGLAQGAGVAPGISRAGITISAGILRGLQREASTKYAFLLAIPIIIGAAAEKARELLSGSFQFSPILVAGFLTATLSGYFSIKYFLKYLKRGNLKIFAYYCWVFGVLTLILSFAKLR